MIDIHCHILPGVDDGSRGMSMSVEMARLARSSGTDVIVATPHCNIPGLFSNYYGSWFDRLFDETREVLNEYGIELLPGMEVFCTYDTPQLIDEGRVLTLNQSRYLLVEFDFGISYDTALSILKSIRERGLTPVIAHAERFDFIKNSPHAAFKLVEAGYILQGNKGSFVGDYGSRVQKTAYLLLKHGLYSVIASDAHNYTSRNPYMKDVYRELKYDISEEILDVLFRENPEKIIENREVRQLERFDFI